MSSMYPHPLVERARRDLQAYNHHSSLLDSHPLIWFQDASLPLIHLYIFCSGFFAFTVAGSEACTFVEFGN